MASNPITSWEIDGETMQTVSDFIFLGSNITADGDCSHEIKRRLLLGRKAMTNLDSILKSRDITLLTKVHLVKAVVFHTWLLMWELDYKETWEPKNWRFWTVGLEKTLESPLDCKEIKPVNPKGNQSWIFTGRTDTEAEAPILWPPDGKNWFTGEDPDAGKDWGRRRRGRQRMRWLDGIIDLMDINLSKEWWTGRPGVLQSMGFNFILVFHLTIGALGHISKHYFKFTESLKCISWKKKKFIFLFHNLNFYFFVSFTSK